MRKSSIRYVHHELTFVDREIINYVREYFFLAPWQLVNLRYSINSLPRVQFKLQLLSGNKKDIPSEQYVGRRGMYPDIEFGNSTYIYFLENDGIKYCRDAGLPLIKRHIRTDHMRTLSPPLLLHALNVNDVLIAGRNLQKYTSDIRLETWAHDYLLQTTPAKVTYDRSHPASAGGGISEQTVKIDPDGMMDFRLQLANAEKERRRVILLEVDRGTETNIDKFKKKMSAYVHYALPNGAFEQMFGKANKRVAWIVTKGGLDRMNTIKAWCEQELEEQGLAHEFNLFRFTYVDQVTEIDTNTGEVKKREALAIDPKELFLSPRWYTPFKKEPDVLLWKQ